MTVDHLSDSRSGFALSGPNGNSTAGVILSAEVADVILTRLAKAVRESRSVGGLDEQAMARRLRSALLPGQAELLDDPTSFLVLAQGAMFQLGIFACDGDQSEVAQFVEGASANARRLVDEPVVAMEDSASRGMRALFAEARVGLPAPGTHLAGRLLGAVAWLAKVIDDIRPEVTSGAVPGTGITELSFRALTSLAVNAPEPLWANILERSGMRDHVGVNGVDPNAVAWAVVDAEDKLNVAVTAAKQRASTLRSASVGVLNSLDNRNLESGTANLLEGQGISVHTLNRLMASRNEYGRAGLLKKILMGDPASLIADECNGLVRKWEAAVARAGEAVRTAERVRIEALARLRPLAAPFEEPPNPLWPDVLRPLTRYVRADEDLLLGARRFPHNLWTVDPLPEQEWGLLPVVDYGYRSVVFLTDRTHFRYDQGCRAATGVVLDQMSKAVPGRLSLTWIDPRGRGQSAGPVLSLLEMGKHLIDDSVWSEPEDITSALRRVSDRMAQLEQRALKDTYPNLDSYNDAAGELAEPNHVVVVTGYPAGFTEDSARRLCQIMEGGERLGISVVVVTDPALADSYRVGNDGHHFVSGVYRSNHELPAHWWNHDLLTPADLVLGHEGHVLAPIGPVGETRWVPCRFPVFPTEAATAIVAGYATATESSAEVKIDSADLVETGTGADTIDSVDIPLGLQGRRDVLSLRLGWKLSQNVLVGGLPGSGKSTLFHTLIASAIRRYDPEELELYLLDFKQGVEFQPYADGALPHARVVAVQSERDFGLSVLRDLRGEIDRRAELLRGPEGQGADGLTEFRRRTGVKLPRVVLVVDEFQVLFSEDDRIAHECAQLLDHIVRQGRAFGVHTVLGTQTLRGHGAMSLLRGTLDQVAVRIVLKTSETDSRLFLADDNPAGSRLTRPGQAVFNGDGGRPEGNVEFQVAHTEDDVRGILIETARRDADNRGFDRRPRVFDGTKAVDVRHDEQVSELLDPATRVDGRKVSLHLGLPVAIKGSGAVALRRASGSNLVIIHREPALAVGALAVALATARLSVAAPLRIVGIDCFGVDDDEEQKLLGVLDVGDNATRVGHAKMVVALNTLAEEVRRRLDRDDSRAERTILVLNALQRARALGDENTYAEQGSARESLLTILAEGPEFGVHTVVLSDSVEAVDKRLGHGGLGQFGARLVGQCSTDASQRLIGSNAAAALGEHYVIVHEPDENRSETLRLFPPPDAVWRAKASQVAAERRALS